MSIAGAKRMQMLSRCALLDGASETSCTRGRPSDHDRLLSGDNWIVPSPSAGRGASQCTHTPLTQPRALTTATTKTPHCGLFHSAQNQNGWLAIPMMQAQRWNLVLRACDSQIAAGPMTAMAAWTI